MSEKIAMRLYILFILILFVGTSQANQDLYFACAKDLKNLGLKVGPTLKNYCKEFSESNLTAEFVGCLSKKTVRRGFTYVGYCAEASRKEKSRNFTSCIEDVKNITGSMGPTLLSNSFQKSMQNNCNDFQSCLKKSKSSGVGLGPTAIADCYGDDKEISTDFSPKVESKGESVKIKMCNYHKSTGKQITLKPGSLEDYKEYTDLVRKGLVKTAFCREDQETNQRPSKSDQPVGVAE